MLNRRWLATLLAILMLVSLLPATALAEDNAEDAASVYVTGEDAQPDDTEDEDEQQPEEVLPADEQPQEVLPALFAAEDDNTVAAQAVAAYAATISGTETITSASKFPLLLQDGAEVTLQGDFEVDYSGNRGQSPITVEDKANVTLVISGHVTLKGGNASGKTGAAAAINVPASATLTIFSAHDNRKDDSGSALSAPVDTLTVYGGNAAEGKEGDPGEASQTFMPNGFVTTTLNIGSGGYGGGGAAAAIGGNGGSGGSGGIYGNAGAPVTTSGDPFFRTVLKENVYVSVAQGLISTISKAAVFGKSGNSGGKAGAIRVVGFLNLEGSGGAAAKGGAGGNGGDSIWTDRIRTLLGQDTPQITVISGPGGGGGGGGGLAAPFIGSGGAGGSGGGSGGVMNIGIYSEGDTISDGTTWSGGGGGGGGWPNGGGGGGGIGASYSDNLIHVNKCAYKNTAWASTDDNDSPYITTDYTVNGHTIRVHETCYLGRDGTNGGKGGGAGLAGSGGNSPSLNGKPDKTGQTGGMYYALGKIGYHCGTGGAGGKGRSSSNAADGGKESMGLSPNGITAASGGGAVAFSPWDNSLILATSVKMLSSTYIDSSYTNTGGCRLADSATCFGAGDGYVNGGVVAAKFPHMLYDLRDCAVDFSSISYECQLAGGKCSGNDTHYYHGGEHYPYMANLKVKYNSTSDSGNYLATCFCYDSASDSFVGQNEVIAYRGGSNLVDCPGKVVVIGFNSGYNSKIFEHPFDYSAILAELSSTNGFAMPGSSTAKRFFVGMVETTIGIQRSKLDRVDMIGKDSSGNDLNSNNKSVYIKDTLYFDAGLYNGSALGSTLNYTYGTDGTGTGEIKIGDIAPKNTGGKIYQWTVKKGDTVVATSNEESPTYTYTPTEPGKYTVTLSLKDMLNFEDKPATLAGDTSSKTISFTVKQKVKPTVSPNSSVHTGTTLTASVDNTIPTGSVTGYKWTYEDGTTLAENSATYTVTAQDVAKGTIVVTPIIAQASQELYEAVSTNITGMLDHSYTNGFCTINSCGEYEPPAQDGDVYQIKNAGNLYWFAAKVNGETAHAQGVTAQADAKAKLTADIALASKHNPNTDNEWTPIGNSAASVDNNSKIVTNGGFFGTFDGGGHTVKGMYISQTSSVLGFVGYLSFSGQVKNLTVSGSIQLSSTNKDGPDTGIGGVVGHASGSAAISDVISNVKIMNNNDASLFHVGGVVGCMRGSDAAVPTLTKSFYGIPYSDSASLPTITLTESSDSIGGVVGCADGKIEYCGNLASSISVTNNVNTIFLVGGIAGQVLSHGSISNSFSYGSLTASSRDTNADSGTGLLAGRCTSGARVTTCVGLTTGNSSISDLVGGKSEGTKTSIEGMTADEFQSGAACYLLNGNTSAENNVWRQNIDNAASNNGASKDAYPHLSTTAKDDIVYYHRDGRYSNSQEVVSVTITWGSMDFTYTPGQWEPTTHNDNHVWAAASDDTNATVKANEVTVSTSAETNVNVKAAFNFTPDSDFESKYGLSGTLKNASDVSISNPVTVAAGGNTVTAKLEIESKTIPESAFGTSKKAQIGTVTVTLTVGS